MITLRAGVQARGPQTAKCYYALIRIIYVDLSHSVLMICGVYGGIYTTIDLNAKISLCAKRGRCFRENEHQSADHPMIIYRAVVKTIEVFAIRDRSSDRIEMFSIY